MLYGTIQNRASRDWRTWWVVRRRSSERAMPPCSAIERSRLLTRHTVIHGANHRNTYSSGRPSDGGDSEQHDLGHDDAPGVAPWRTSLRSPRSRPLRFFHPEMPNEVAGELAAERVLAIG